MLDSLANIWAWIILFKVLVAYLSRPGLLYVLGFSSGYVMCFY